MTDEGNRQLSKTTLHWLQKKKKKVHQIALTVNINKYETPSLAIQAK